VRYVCSTNEDSTVIAGERLEDLEAALDCMQFDAEELGGVTLTGTLPEDLSRCLERALLTIEAQTVADGHDPSDNGEWHPMRQLLLRIGQGLNGRTVGGHHRNHARSAFVLWTRGARLG